MKRNRGKYGNHFYDMIGTEARRIISRRHPTPQQARLRACKLRARGCGRQIGKTSFLVRRIKNSINIFIFISKCQFQSQAIYHGGTSDICCAGGMHWSCCKFSLPKSSTSTLKVNTSGFPNPRNPHFHIPDSKYPRYRAQ